MKTTYYEIAGGLKWAEEDDYKRGCLPDTAQKSEIRVSFRADTLPELLAKVKDFHGIDEDDSTAGTSYQGVEFCPEHAAMIREAKGEA